MRNCWDAVVVGAGAAGIFAALRAKECSPGLRLLVVDRAARPLRKVAISGGGRCNVTHACQDLDRLLSCYPRGGPRLEAILGRFMPEDTVRWFQAQGVRLKTEADGRMFPFSDSSQTVIDCLLDLVGKRGVEMRLAWRVDDLRQVNGSGFALISGRDRLLARKVLLATGGGSPATRWLKAMGHEVVADVPSLFTFKIQHPLIEGLQGLSVNPTRLRLQAGGQDFEAEGPLLITHWGLSGPAVLKLSAFAARALAASGYRGELTCNLLPDIPRERMRARLPLSSPKGVLTASPFASLPKRLWQRLAVQAGAQESTSWRQASPALLERLETSLQITKLPLQGKGVFKEEFVTAGGLPLQEVDPYTMESRRVQGLYVAGELLDVDGITGGFNFQNAWASGYIAGEGLSG